MSRSVRLVKPGCFEPEEHFYPKALNAQIHPMVAHFFNLDHDRIVQRYAYLNPKVDGKSLSQLLNRSTKFFHWGGADLFYVTTEQGNRQMVVLETNSCPSGQKSMPPKSDGDEHRGYRSLIEDSFLTLIKGKRLPKGVLAVIYDKNPMEVTGYAATLADLSREDVWLVPCFDQEKNPIVYRDGVLHLINEENEEIPIRACLRYVTQKPWNRLPVVTKTFVYNSTLVCLAGGRNKLVASKAYDLFNASTRKLGLKINTPETVEGVGKLEIPMWVDRFGGFAVIKNPYSNAGQGVYTITNSDELEEFMKGEYDYDQFIVQSLIGHAKWSSQTEQGKYYHIGTVPNKKGEIFVADLRMMVYATPTGFRPAALYARKSRSPLKEALDPGQSSWDVLGTNLSIKKGKDQWDSDTHRLMLMDRKDFNNLGLGLDDLIEAYIQAVLSVTAIDEMAEKLISAKGGFRMKLFKSLNHDQTLCNEVLTK
ncbi:MAG: hypothetical protein COW01_13875 [Bdellovibrionales bacterium CG12_big_fil_rev_8_21_14_0_65_38_15]|nr:MAG: hypothetical protein COW79_16695 [Bdellovibrionales bacterium CG22_combo_CG10-13_8_21_14_all_38_13]PIQ53360.1 MAG: hypothetical protein COW01_13875 [Bdellovibrionales bacterium CG12_big_fil_rev_8_21_14_0_65_38_15]PIR30276.1 MAG: hypothetical protein COV38_05880 [Bdellovibrionales bacterium CG11_big_fil_rev_8_21_14_0_20_38_13]